MTEEGADPISGPLSEHRVSILTAGDYQVGVVFEDRGKRKVSDGTGVARSDEGNSLWVSCH